MARMTDELVSCFWGNMTSRVTDQLVICVWGNMKICMALCLTHGNGRL